VDIGAIITGIGLYPKLPSCTQSNKFYLMCFFMGHRGSKQNTSTMRQTYWHRNIRNFTLTNAQLINTCIIS